MPNVEYKGTFVVSAYLADDEFPLEIVVS